MQRLEVSGAVRPIYGSLGVKQLKVRFFVPFPLLKTLFRRKRQIQHSRTKHSEPATSEHFCIFSTVVHFVTSSLYIYIYTHTYCAVLQRLGTPSDFHIPLPSILPFAHFSLSSTHGCIYPIFSASLGTAFFFFFLQVSS